MFAFRVRDVPQRCDGPDNRAFTFRVEHVPEDENYAHSEVRTYCDGERATRKPPGSVRTQFRLKLFSAGEVLKQPDLAR